MIFDFRVTREIIQGSAANEFSKYQSIADRQKKFPNLTVADACYVLITAAR